jgi:very-short-patch-repair endonuclease
MSFRSALEPPPDFEHGREVIDGAPNPCDQILLDKARERLDGICESPIEYQLGAPLIVAAEKWGFTVQPQFSLDRYRYDFAIIRATGKIATLVECDGREFHSTEKQKANDRAKDTAARKAGPSVSRVTGKEIFRNPKEGAERLIFSVWTFHDA